MPLVAYINFSKYPARNIEKKIEAMARGAQSAGIRNFDFFYINGEKTLDTGLVKYIRFPNKYLFLNYYDFFFSRYKLISQSLDLGKYNFIILRYSGGDPTGVDFFKTHRIISEHHTLEMPEHRSQLKAGLPIHEHILKKVRLKLEQKYGPLMLHHSSGIVGVTREISDYEALRAGVPKPIATIPNGITVRDIHPSGFKKFDGKHLDLAILAGGLAPWHGIDRLIHSVSLYKGPLQIRLHVIGNIPRSNFLPSTDNVKIHFYGYKTGNDLDSLLGTMTIGIGTLCLFRNGMKEACALKTREYTARGLPFVIAYKDDDLLQIDQNNPFFIEFNNDQTMIDMEKIIEFAEQVSRRKDLPNYMRHFALEHMDWSVKLKGYANFIQHIDQANA